MAQAGGGATSSLHGISGVMAIALMLFHAVWATVVIVRNDKRWRKSFHRLSIIVWLFWLIPYAIGLLLGVPAFAVSDPVAAVSSFAFVFILAWTFHVSAHRKRRMHAQ